MDPSQLGTLSPAVVNQRAAGVSPAGTVGDIDLSKLSYRGRSGHGGGALAPCMYVRSEDVLGMLKPMLGAIVLHHNRSHRS